MIKKKNWGYLISSTFLLVFIVLIIVIPFIHMIAVSFSDTVSVLSGAVGLVPKNFTLEMYMKVFENDTIIRAYGNTITYTLVGTVISLLVTSTGAYALSTGRMVGHSVLSFLILFTMFFSGGMIPTYLVVKNVGILDTMWAVVLPGAVTTWNFIIMRSFFQAFPKEIEEAGSVDGLTDIGIFFRLVCPSSKAVFATIGLYYAVSLWNAYFIPFLYINDSSLYPLQIVLRQVISFGSSSSDGGSDALVADAALKYATIMVSVTPIMCVYPFIQKYFAKGVLVGSVKG